MIEKAGLRDLLVRWTRSMIVEILVSAAAAAAAVLVAVLLKA